MNKGQYGCDLLYLILFQIWCVNSLKMAQLCLCGDRWETYPVCFTMPVYIFKMLFLSLYSISEKSLLDQTNLPSSVHFQSEKQGSDFMTLFFPASNSSSKDPFFVKRKPDSLLCYCPFLFPDCQHSLQKSSFHYFRKKTVQSHAN